MSNVRTHPQEWIPDVDPCSAKDKDSFAYTSTVTRWPSILTQAIDGLYQASNALVYSRIDQSEKIQESKSIIEKISGLKHDLGRDRPLLLIPSSNENENNNEPSNELLNSIIKESNSKNGENSLTWFNAPWLFAECYLYTLLRHFFSQSKHWKAYDPFAKSKLNAFQSSGTAIKALAETLEELLVKAEEEKKSGLSQEKILEAQKVIWHTMSQSSLWGNATDLSLLTSLSYSDIQKLQTTDSASQEARSKFILTGTSALDESWEKILEGGKKNGRVDIILDNSGFELVTDLMMGDWLLSTGHVKEVVFHPKNMPWFVSDVCAPDFRHTFDSLLEADFFTSTSNNSNSQERVRSISRTRDTQADPNFDTRGEGKPHPVGSKQLQMSEEDIRGRKQTESPSGSRSLQARSDSIEGLKIGQGKNPEGSRSLKGDPIYFQNSRNRTISPSRSYVVNSESFSNLSIHDEEENGNGNQGRTSLGRNSSIRSGPISRSGLENQSPERERRGRSKDTSIQHMVRRWNNHLDSGKFKLSIPLDSKLGSSGGEIGDFWTLPIGYANMGIHAPKLLQNLAESSLVIFKGDLNYRKLTSDLKWDSTTPFRDSLGPLAGKINLITFRTNKADVCVGLKKEVLEEVVSKDKDWRINGKWAVLQFCGKD